MQDIIQCSPFLGVVVVVGKLVRVRQGFEALVAAIGLVGVMDLRKSVVQLSPQRARGWPVARNEKGVQILPVVHDGN